MKETNNKLTATQREIIMQNPKVQAFDGAVARLENASRIAGVQIACLVYQADHDGTASAMGLSSAADYLQQVRRYSKSQAMNLQRVGKFLKGDPDAAVDTNGNCIQLSAIVQLLESANDDTQARKLIADGTVSALTPVKKLKKQIDAINGKAIAVESTAKDVTDEQPASKDEQPASKSENPADVYRVDVAVVAPDGKGGSITVKSENYSTKLVMLPAKIEKLLALATAPNAKVVISVYPRK